ncbi:multicomponent Na+:H+ antiporter subunit B [Acetoanaerobium pronyense]|uniref:Multicomponent Na+:H+ antiporter subunit B n=1 Tax=Acetoanaerobium pronyense TaxID=1482736 RepID=A0ABS4KL85_9FIRM|nr:MnhB domain-containing protein [Acetoanaerobium pronyense]MBP2027901.1 multicomponent Na+:H+ antiporter subunit B [Acetoanaerobium pronyense]
MKDSIIFRTVSRILFSFMLIFGIYIVAYGDLSPGGGFQGGAILTTAYLFFYFIELDNKISLKKLIKMEKILFLIMVCSGFISFLFYGEFFTNPIVSGGTIHRRIFLVFLNLIIASKVTIGLIGIVESFIEEEDNGI